MFRRASILGQTGDLHQWPNLDRSFLGRRNPIGNPHRIVDVFCVDQEVAAELFAGFGKRAVDTDWRAILRFYDKLGRVQPSPVVSLNRAVAVTMVDGPEAALALVAALSVDGELDHYYLLHAARAELLRRIGSHDAAAGSYRRALELATNDSERRSWSGEFAR